MKHHFARKLALNLCLILALFAVSLLIFEFPRGKKHKKEMLEERLDAYTEATYLYFLRYNFNENIIDANSLLYLFPDNLRLTIIDNFGDILYDNRLEDLSITENHAGRPEIKAAAKRGKGSDIRISASTNKPYLYYAKRFGDKYIRVALPYDGELQYLLKPDNAFIYYLLALFILGIVFAYYTSLRFGKVIKRLSDYSSSISKNLPVNIPDFPNDEIGEISKQIAEDYKRLKESETKLSLEHCKLLMHIQSLAEGICFFTAGREVAFYNGLFIQYLNVISDRSTIDMSEILNDAVFVNITSFINNRNGTDYFETVFRKHGKFFTGRVNVFEDQSFEIVLYDNSRQEQSKLLKRELTGNIAHELRTPITGVRGYLETILNNNLVREKEREFIAKAHDQIVTLSEQIRDIIMLSKINEFTDSFQFKNIALQSVIDKVTSDLGKALQAKNIAVHSTLPPDLSIFGNESLLYFIFRNLIDNVINYAGENRTIKISQGNKKGNFVSLSFSDNGVGIKNEEHLVHLFDRFYRVEEGRTRDTGGSGLGLSIVKNGVDFHGGSISVRNHVSGGLEFLFTLPLKR